MLRTILWFGYFWGSLISYIPPYLKLGKMTESEQQIAAFKRAKKWSQNLLKIAGTEITVEGLENVPNDVPVLVIGNHQSNFDIPIVLAIMPNPFGFMAKIELSKMPFVNGWMRALKCVFMDRSDIRQQVRSIGEGSEILKSGSSLVLFPEGTRSKTGELGEFKAGGLKLATKSKTLILPIAIDGSIRIMQRDSLIIHPAKVKVTILEPYALESKDTVVEMAIIKDRIEKVLKDNEVE